MHRYHLQLNVIVLLSLMLTCMCLNLYKLSVQQLFRAITSMNEQLMTQKFAKYYLSTRKSNLSLLDLLLTTGGSICLNFVIHYLFYAGAEKYIFQLI